MAVIKNIQINTALRVKASFKRKFQGIYFEDSLSIHPKMLS